MHRPSIPTLVFRHLYPAPKANDPTCFAMHLTRNLIPEVRAETSTFYGTLETVEARYPGLDYTHAPHRRRLGRFVYHRRLFRAFDELGLTKEEILAMCRWEGTRWARESFEKQEGVKVRDTTGDEVGPWVPRERRLAIEQAAANQARIGQTDGPCHAGTTEDDGDHRVFDFHGVVEDEDDAIEAAQEGTDDEVAAAVPETVEEARDESDGEPESIGIELNQRLTVAAEARAQGHTNVVMDEAYEQWLKEATERGFGAWPGPLRNRSHHHPLNQHRQQRPPNQQYRQPNQQQQQQRQSNQQRHQYQSNQRRSTRTSTGPTR